MVVGWYFGWDIINLSCHIEEKDPVLPLFPLISAGA